MSQIANAPEAVKIGPDNVDWVQQPNGTIVLSHVYTGAARRILRRAFLAFQDLHDTKVTYPEMCLTLEKFLPRHQGLHLYGTIQFVTPHVLRYTLPSGAYVEVPGTLPVMLRACNICGRYGRMKCHYCPIAYCSHVHAEATPDTKHSCSK